MNYLQIVVIALFAVGEIYGANLECPSICPAVYQPTCARNGNEYIKFNNPCWLKVFNCDRRRSSLPTYTPTDIDWCTTIDLDNVEIDLLPDLENADHSCYRPCPMIYRPVCGSNGTYRKTFTNECSMKTFDCFFKSQDNNNWRVLQRSKCSQDE